ncbi:MAG TPA: acyl-CoA dehydrogenase family protein [Rhizomicrobium sp.]|jgi:alkylation response protein AidB-like acyl-CoA dehydrogenase|nr:acyl-CoA dehydrogenase family protein [Rhizomicrobium sp.]
MDLQLNDSQKVLVDSAQRFFARSYPLERMREIFLLNDTFDAALWREIGELGWNAVALPEDIGGYDGSAVDALLLLIEMGRAGCLSPYAHSSVAAALALARIDPALASEIAASQMSIMPVPAIRMRSHPAIARGRLHGHAQPVAWADTVTHLLCEFDDQAYLVAMAHPAVRREKLASVRGEPLYDVRFGGADAQSLGPARPLFDALRDFGAFACAGLLQGIGERSLELAVDYAKERIQFGRPIGSFQAIQHKAADMRIASEVSRVLVLRAAAERDPERFSAAASRAKAWNCDAVRKITREAMQIFGGVSFAGDHVIQLMYQAVITLGSHYEAAHEHRARLATALLG